MSNSTTSHRTRQAVVTGASRGLGQALATALVSDGWHVTITGRNPDSLHAASRRIAGRHQHRVTVLAGDVTDATHRTQLTQLVAGLTQVVAGGLDLLVNNASALTTDGHDAKPLPRVAHAPLDDLWSLYDTNVRAPIALIQELLPRLSAVQGTIMNVSSDAALGPYEGWGLYGSSKAALDQFTNVLAAEQPNLAVYAIDPGDMRTQMHQDAFPGEDISDRPEPHLVVPALLRLVNERPPSGRYVASDLLAEGAA